MAISCGESFSPATSWLVQNELASLEHDFAAGRILDVPVHWLMGIEIDFDIHRKSSAYEQLATLEASRESMFAELSLLVPKNEEQAERKAKWLQQIPELTPKELINYQIYRRLSVPTLDSPNTSMYLGADDSPETTLEFVFGNGEYQTGYYDNPGCFEMRTQAAKPSIANERKKRAVAVGRAVAEQFGTIFAYKGDHSNFSLWTPGENGMRTIHSLDSQEGQEIARRGVAGMLYALRDSLSVILPVSYYSMPPEKVSTLAADPERDGTFRVVPDRFEQRLPVGEHNHEINALGLMSGCAHGINNEAIDTSFTTVTKGTLLTAGPGYDKVRDLYLLRALQQSLLDDGSFVFPGVSWTNEHRAEGMVSSIIGTEAYVRGNASYIIKTLLGTIALTPEGSLEVDEDTFNKTAQNLSYYYSTSGTPRDTITERLSRIKVLPESAIVLADLECELPCAVRFHNDLAGYASRPSLGYIGTDVLEAIARERAATFTPEEAVFRYIDHKILDTSRLSTDDKIRRLQDVLRQFPDADPTVVRARIENEVGQRVERFVEAAKLSSQKGEDTYSYKGYLQSLSMNLELYDTLTGINPPRKAEDLLRVQETITNKPLAVVYSFYKRGIQRLKSLQKSA